MFLAALLLHLAAPDSAQATAPAPGQTVYCGGTTDVATVERYFSDLRQALASSAPRARFNDFVGNHFGTTSARSRTLHFRLRDIGWVTPGRISIREWQEISRRGARSLHNAGWRGCFMDHGKVWFQAGGEEGFRLFHISRNLPWVEPERGDALP
jgi:hypothetical protein